jgi:hypothetical protein
VRLVVGILLLIVVFTSFVVTGNVLWLILLVLDTFWVASTYRQTERRE